MTSAESSDGQPRRRRSLSAFAPSLLFIATTVVFLWPAIMAGGPLGATDHLFLTSPYRESVPAEARSGNPLQTDQMVQLPFVEEFWRSARQGELQLWEPNVGGGVPLLTGVYNRASGPWYAVLLFVPPEVGLTVAVGILFLVAQAGTYALARRLGAAVPGATLAAVVYAFSGPTVVSVHRIHEVFLFPVFLWAVHRAVIRQRRVDLVLLSVTTTVVWISGFPSAALFASYTAAAFGIHLVIEDTHRSGEAARSWARNLVDKAIRPACAATAGLMLASPLLLPTVEFLRTTSSLERRYDMWHAAGLAQLADTISGRFFGATQHGDWWLPDARLSNAFEASTTVGVVALGLSIAVVVLRRSPSATFERCLRRFFLPVAIIVLVAVYIGGPVLGAIQLLPFASSNPFNRARFVLVLAIALTAAFGLDGLLASKPRRNASGLMLRLEVAFVLAMVGVGVLMGLRLAAENYALKEVAADLIVPGIVGTVALALLALTRRAHLDHPVLIGAFVTALAAVELIWGTWGFTPASPPGTLYPDQPAFDAIEENVGPQGAFRFAGAGLDVLPPHSAALLDLSDARVQFPASRAYEEVLVRADPGLQSVQGAESIFKVKFTDELDLGSPILDRVSVRYMTESLKRGPFELGDAVTLPFPEAQELPASFDLTIPEGGARAVRLPIQPSDARCTEGWVEITDGRTSSRRLLRDARDSLTFALPDLKGGSRAMRATSTHCRVKTTGAEMAVSPPSADSSLRVVSVDGWVVHERSSARPRWELAVRVIAVRNADDRLSTLASEPARTVIVEDPSLEGALGGGTVRPEHVGPDRIELQVHSDGPGLLVLRDVAAPGWKVEIDGEDAPLVNVDHAFMGARVPPGTSDVTFRYAPRMFMLGLWLAVAALISVGLLIWRTPRPPPPRPVERPS